MMPISPDQFVSVGRKLVAGNPGCADQTEPVKEPAPEYSRKAVNYFFSKLEGFCPSKFEHLYPAERLTKAKREWLPILSRLTRIEIDAGFHKAKVKLSEGDQRYAWPDIGTIIGLCKLTAEELGLPSPDQAYREAAMNADNPVKHGWSHELIRMAGKSIGWHELRTQTEEKTRKRFEQAYVTLCNRLVAGEDLLSPVALGLEDQSKSSVFDAANRLAEEKLQGEIKRMGIKSKCGFKDIYSALRA